MRNLLNFSIATILIFCGCNKKEEPAHAVQNSQTSSEEIASDMAAMPDKQATVSVSTPVLQPILTAWQEGRTAEAVNLFTEANWNARPVFSSDMAVGFTDARFKALPDSERQLRYDEMLAQLDLLKQVAAGVNAAADGALSKGDTLRARQCYEALRKFGAALDDPQLQQLLRMVGQVSQRMGEQGIARLKT